MSIYVRPVREQIEHDRVIRHLHSKLKRKYDVAMNVGAEQSAASVKGPIGPLFPDLVLTTMDRAKKLAGVIEVETGESVHHLEAMAQWAPFGRLRVPFHLYVPMSTADMAKRLAADLGAHVTELWSYQSIGDQIRLNLVQKTPLPGGRPERVEREPAAGRDARESRELKDAKKPAARSAAKTAAKPARPGAKPARPAAGKSAARTAKPAPKAKPAKGKPGKAAVRKPAARKPAASKKPARRPAKRR